MELTTKAVGFLAGECRAANDTPEAQVIQVIGSRFRGRFDPHKIQEHRVAITELVNQLPLEFHQQGGGGWTMLNAVVRQDGVQWTDFQLQADVLACLAIAAGAAQWALPRALFDWSRLPGGLPYLIVGPCQAPGPGTHLQPASSSSLAEWLAK